MVTLVWRLSIFFRKFERQSARITKALELYVLKRKCPEHWQEIEELSNRINTALNNMHSDVLKVK